jgi:putative endopeptidase
MPLMMDAVVFKRKWKLGLIDGTPEQRFLCLGPIWRSKARDEATKNQVKQIHPRNVPRYVPLQNVDTFIRRSVFK